MGTHESCGVLNQRLQGTEQLIYEVDGAGRLGSQFAARGFGT